MSVFSRPFAGNGTAQSVPVDVRCPSIREGLAALGHDKHRKFFLKPEVEVIVRGLGEP